MNRRLPVPGGRGSVGEPPPQLRSMRSAMVARGRIRTVVRGLMLTTLWATAKGLHEHGHAPFKTSGFPGPWCSGHGAWSESKVSLLRERRGRSTTTASASGLLAHQPETEAESLVRRSVGVAQGAAATGGVEVPAAAADDSLPLPVAAARVPQGLGGLARGTSRVTHRPARVVAVPVLAPLPDVAVHVEQAPGIRCIAAGRRRPAQEGSSRRSRQRVAAIVVGLAGGEVPTGREGTRAPRPAGLLPLGLGGQPEPLAARAPRQLAEEDLDVVVADVLDRAVRPAGGELAGLAVHQPAPLPLRDLVLAEKEAARDLDLVRHLVRLPVRLARIAPHAETAGGDEGELHSSRRLSPGACTMERRGGGGTNRPRMRPQPRGGAGEAGEQAASDCASNQERSRARAGMTRIRSRCRATAGHF